MFKLHEYLKAAADESEIVLFNAAKPPERHKTLKCMI